ncbi:MAG: hypothetical protein Q7J84_16370 [Sulfuricaulis sp.]|nr:hypothetical protein [Sulfuricaulis sp.]
MKPADSWRTRRLSGNQGGLIYQEPAFGSILKVNFAVFFHCQQQLQIIHSRRTRDSNAKKAGHKKSPGNKGRVSGAEHAPDDVHPGLFPLREVERERTKSKSCVTIIDLIAFH